MHTRTSPTYWDSVTTPRSEPARHPAVVAMLACGYQNAGLHVFDTRDPQHPKEIACFKPPAVRKAVLPGSGSWAPGIDRTVDKISGFPRFRTFGTRAREMQIWFVSDGNGFQVVRFTDAFMALHKELFQTASD